MTIDKLLGSLANSRVNLFLEGNRLKYRAPEGALTPELFTVIGKHRTEIIEHLRGDGRSQGRTDKCVICDWQYWVDDPPKDGRIRTTCGKCGSFIGYRSAEF